MARRRRLGSTVLGAVKVCKVSKGKVVCKSVKAPAKRRRRLGSMVLGSMVLGAASKASSAEGIDKRGKFVKLVVMKQVDEWQVRVYENGKYKEGPTYYAGDKQDAVDTFKMMKAQYGLAGLRRDSKGRFIKSRR